jgi:hypothetical protein
MVGIEHHLVTGLEHGIAERLAIDHAAFGRAEVAQHHFAAMDLQTRMAVGECRFIDADIGLGGTPHQARPLEGEAAAVVLATDAAQHHAGVAGLGAAVVEAGVRLPWWLRRHQPHLGAVDKDRVAHAQHRHATHRTAIDMHAAGFRGNREPYAATVDAERNRRR